jgi:outer membrane protein assembly factor BamB
MKRSLYPLVAGAALCAGDAADWTRFRGPNGDGVAPDAHLPSKLDASSIRWSAPLPGRGLSSPITVGDRVFVTSCTGGRQERLHVLCFEISTGALKWERQFWATGRTQTHEKISTAAPTPVTDGNAVYALFSSNDCVALDLDGNLLWFRGLGRDYPNASNSLGMTSALVAAEGVVIAQVESDSEAYVAGLDARTGTNRWRIDRPRRANWTSPTLATGGDGKTVAVVQSWKGLTAIEPSTGKTVWSYDDGAATTTSTTVSGGKLYVPSKGLTALEPGGDGKPVKQLWRAAQMRPGMASPVVIGDKAYILNDGGIISCADLSAEGKRLWQVRLKGEFSATPVAAGQFLYCISEDGLVQVVDTAAPGGAVVGELKLGGTIVGTPAIAGDSLFVRSDGNLWRIGGRSELP